MAAPAAARAFDLLVIGGGSGGIACARRAAAHGARVALVEAAALGGTCVNVGCVPKKLMFTATSLLADVRHHAAHFGVRAGAGAPPGALADARIDLAALKGARDAYVKRLATVSYPGYLQQSGVELVAGAATLLGAGLVEVAAAAGAPAQRLSAPHILIATGGRPRALGVPGDELAIDSDGVFDLEAAPDRVTIVGAGYIAVEMAGILAGLGSAVTLLARDVSEHVVLRGFDESMRAAVAAEMRRSGIALRGGVSRFARIERRADGRLDVVGSVGSVVGSAEGSEGPLAPPADVVLQAIGRDPNTRGLGLDAAGVRLDARGHVAVDDFQNTSASGVYAVGDVASSGFALTPVAIAAGRLLADRLFGGAAHARARVRVHERRAPTRPPARLLLTATIFGLSTTCPTRPAPRRAPRPPSHHSAAPTRRATSRPSSSLTRRSARSA